MDWMRCQYCGNDHPENTRCPIKKTADQLERIADTLEELEKNSQTEGDRK